MNTITIGRTVRGASHIRADKICQDYHKIIRTPDYIITAVCDGHGSDSCPYSDEGAKIAADVFGELMEGYCDGNFGDILFSVINQDKELTIPQKIESAWKSKILERHKKFNREILDDEKIFKQYGTTLLGLLLTENFVFAFQLGDGDIIYIDSENIVPVCDAEKFLGVETNSLSGKDAWRNSVAVVKNICNEKSFLYILTTDGMANSYISQEDFYKACRDYFEIFNQNGSDYINQNLSEWLNEVSTKGSGDDVTAVFTYHNFNSGSEFNEGSTEEDSRCS